MSHACCGDSGGQETRRSAPAPRATDWLAFAASPTFAIMALLTAVLGGGNMLCQAMPNASPLSGMAFMYLLMSAFHLTPWLKLVRIDRMGGGLWSRNHQHRQV